MSKKQTSLVFDGTEMQQLLQQLAEGVISPQYYRMALEGLKAMKTASLNERKLRIHERKEMKDVLPIKTDLTLLAGGKE